MDGGSKKAGRTLFIKNFPNAISSEERDQLLYHFGVKSVHSYQPRSQYGGCLLAEFYTDEDASRALRQLHQLEILNRRLRVEYAYDFHQRAVREEAARTYEGKVTTKEPPINSCTGGQSPAPKMNPDMINTNLIMDIPPVVRYKYPSPTVTILTNIANAMASVPAFYTQVLHLMNKMNMTPPFTAVPTPSPSLPGDSTLYVSLGVQTDSVRDDLSSGESELEMDDEERKRHQDLLSELKKLERPRKRKRVAQTLLQAGGPLEGVFEPREFHPRRIEFKLKASISNAVGPSLGLEPADAIKSAVTHGTDGDPGVKDPGSCKSTITGSSDFYRKDELNTEDDDSEDGDSNMKYASRKHIAENRDSLEELHRNSVFRNYEAGPASSHLYIKNLSKHVEEKDLHYIFYRFIKDCSAEDRNKFSVKLMKEGRMKGQAFIIFPNEIIASEALSLTIGYRMHGKPMVVMYARSSKEKTTA